MTSLSDEARRRDRALASSVGAAVVARGLSAAGSVVSLGLAARALSEVEFGVVAVLALLSIYFAFGDFGMGTRLLTQLPGAHARGDHAAMRSILGEAMSAMLVIAGAAVVLGSLSVLVVPWHVVLGAQALPPDQVAWCMVAFLVCGAVGLVGTVGTRVLAALQRGALLRTSDAIASVLVVLGVAACWRWDGPLWAYVVAFAGPMPLNWMLQLRYVRRAYPEMAFSRGDLGLRAALGFLRLGVPYAVLSLGWVVAYTLDAVVVSALLGASQAAVFAVAARLFSLVTGTLTLAGQQMWPAMAEALARGEAAWVRRRFRHSLVVVGSVATACCVALVLIGPAFAEAWVGADLVPPVELFAVFAVWTVYFTVITQYGYLTLAGGRIRLLAGLAIVVAVANLGVSILLTEQLGLVGPVIGSLVAGCLIQWPATVALTRRLIRDKGIAVGSSKTTR